MTADPHALERKAREIANELRRRGLPVRAYSNIGGKIGVTFQLEDEPASYTARCAAAEASPEFFEALYRAVA